MAGLTGRDVILASASPRRSALLEQMGIGFSVIPSDIDEVLDTNMPMEKSLCDLALRKGMAVAAHHPGCLVISADTSVILGDEIYGKPRDQAEAKRMLESLSGKEHRVVTGLALICREASLAVSDSETTFVKFRELGEQPIDRYISTGEPMDKAGSYAIQGFGASFVEYVRGCYFNVVGLPVSLLGRWLESLDMPVWNSWPRNGG